MRDFYRIADTVLAEREASEIGRGAEGADECRASLVADPIVGEGPSAEGGVDVGLAADELREHCAVVVCEMAGVPEEAFAVCELMYRAPRLGQHSEPIIALLAQRAHLGRERSVERMASAREGEELLGVERPEEMVGDVLNELHRHRQQRRRRSIREPSQARRGGRHSDHGERRWPRLRFFVMGDSA